MLDFLTLDFDETKLMNRIYAYFSFMAPLAVLGLSIWA